MKPGARPCCEQACNERTRNAEPSQSTGHVDRTTGFALFPAVVVTP
jgi:hypothetical protein